MHKHDLENSFLLPGRVRRHSRNEDSMGPIIIWAEVVRERYKIRSISLSVLNTTETNLDTSLFGVIRSPFPSGPPDPGIVRPFSLRAGSAADKAPAFSATRRHFETHASSIKQRLHSSPIVLSLNHLRVAKITNATLTQGVPFSRRYRESRSITINTMTWDINGHYYY